MEKKASRFNRLETWLERFKAFQSKHFVLLFIVISVAYIWSSEWFVTTDGPSHAYNSMLLGEYLFGEWKPYQDWLKVFWFPFPNWTGHIALSMLLQVFSIAVSEKILYSVYVITYFLGLHRLAQSAGLNPWLLIALFSLFVFPQTFTTGFFNYQLGYAILPWLLSAFLQLKSGYSLNQWFGLLLLSMLSYFTHPIPFLLFLMVAGLLVLFQNQWWSSWDQLKRTVVLFAPLIPSLAMMGYFLHVTVDGATNSPVQATTLIADFLALTSLMNYNLDREMVVTVSVSIMLGVFLIMALFRFQKALKTKLQWTFLLGFVITTLFYFFQPGSFSSAGILTFRIQFIPHLFLILFCVSIAWSKWIQMAMSAAFLVLFALVLIIRLPHKIQASNAMTEMMSVCDKMEKHKVSVGLDCFHNGLYEGKLIAKSNWIFTHCADYVNTEMEQLSLVNYESGQFHFPIKWTTDFNAYESMSCNEGLEHIPPCLRIDQAEEMLGLEVDYVFFVFPNQDQLHNHVNYKTSIENLGANFELVYTSETGIVELFQRIDLNQR